MGYDIMRYSHVDNLKRVTLELGGKSPVIVLGDANVEQAVAHASFGAWINSGQCCIAGTRTFVHESIYDEFIEKAGAAAKAQQVCDPST